MWENFKTFNSKLTGKDVFNRQSYGREQVVKFLADLHNDLKGYRIGVREHQDGVRTLYREIISKPVAEVEIPVKVKYHSIELDIRDFDAALGYIFSVYPLPAKHRTSNTYLPLLTIYCKFIELMTHPSTGVCMNKTPTTACIVVGAPPNKGGVKAIMFGSTIRSNNNKRLQDHRHAQLLSAYVVPSLEVKEGIIQKFGHCAETYPYIWNIKPTAAKRTFEGPVQGIAVNVQEVANMAGFALQKFQPSSWKGPCENCMELLNLGGFPAYDIFPHAALPGF